MFVPIVADERVSERFGAGLTAAVAVLGQHRPVEVTRDNLSHDAHPPVARDIGHDMMALDVHLDQRLLHVLNVSGRVLEQPLPLSKIRTKRHRILAGTEARAQQATLLELLKPPGIIDVRLATGDLVHIPSVDHQHLEPPTLQDLEHWDPVHARRPPRLSRDAHGLEPVSQSMELVRETPKGPHGLGVPVCRHGHHMESGAHIDPSRIWMNGREAASRLLPFGSPSSCHRSLLVGCAPRGWTAERRHSYKGSRTGVTTCRSVSVLGPHFPRRQATNKLAAAPLGSIGAYVTPESLSRQERVHSSNGYSGSCNPRAAGHSRTGGGGAQRVRPSSNRPCAVPRRDPLGVPSCEWSGPTARTLSLAACGKTPAAFDRRCIPHRTCVGR